MNIDNLTEEQKSALRAEFKAQEEAEKLSKAQKEADYKVFASEVVKDVFSLLKQKSEDLTATKKNVVDSLMAVIDLKTELYKHKAEQKSHTFISADNTSRVTIGYHERDGWDDTAGQGEELIKNAIKRLATDEKSEALVEVVLKLLSKDKAGNFKIKQVFELQCLAEKIGDPDISEGVRILREAYRPERTKTFIIAEEKTPMGSWRAVPLGITEA